MVEPCLGIADELDATLIDMRFIKPLDKQAVQTSVQHHEFLVTVEENAIAGGAGSGVNELIATLGKAIITLNIGLKDTFIQHGTREECLQQAGLDAAGILRQITEFLEQGTPDRHSLSSVQ
jgi:1-deoxy-D-xylulose-5-phosphate synthase